MGKPPDYNMACDFSHNHYREIIRGLKNSGYKFCFFDEPKDGSPRCYLRHDIDLSPEKALLVAELEKEEGAVSTYFVRICSPYYNIFEPKIKETLEKIAGLGHRIGLHFEGGSGAGLEDEIIGQLSILQNVFKTGVVVSFHRPQDGVFSKNFGSFTNAYGPDFFSKAEDYEKNPDLPKFVSDSKGVWRFGCPCLLKDRPKTLQVLTHPIWWGREEKDNNLHLQNWLKGEFENLDDYLSRDIEPYKNKIFNK